MGARDTETVWRDGKPCVDHALLEDQMCSYTGGPGEESPDVLDALVWGLTSLMIEEKESGGVFIATATEEEETQPSYAGNDFMGAWGSANSMEW